MSARAFGLVTVRPQRAYGRPGTAVIPPDWGASHAPVAAGTMTARVSLHHTGGTITYQWSDAEQRNVPTLPAAYATDVPARLQANRETSRGDDAVSAEESIKVSGYLISLPLDGDGVDEIAVGDTIAVTTSDDPELEQITLRVVDIVRGSLRFERDVFASVNDPQEG